MKYPFCHLYRLQVNNGSSSESMWFDRNEGLFFKTGSHYVVQADLELM